MKKIGDDIYLNTQEARGGDTPNVVRYVLAISLLLAIIALSAVWITGAWSNDRAQGWPVTAEEHALGG